MQRIIWIGGVACVANVACIEDRTPEGDVDAAVDAARPDAAPEPEARPLPPPPVPEPESSEPEPNEPEPSEPEPSEPEPGEPEPDPELPPWICPPEGRFVFNVGTCVSEVGADEPAEVLLIGPIDGQITAFGEGVPEGACIGDGWRPIAGRIGSDRTRWFNLLTSDGRTWQIVLDLPVDMRLEVGEMVSINAALEAGWFEGLSGHVAISTAEGLQAFVQAGVTGSPGLEYPDLHLERGGQSCYWEEPEAGFCTYTGHRLRADDPRTDEVFELSYGQVADIGPYQVINGGIMSIGDRGACNAAPENFKIAAWRRR